MNSVTREQQIEARQTGGKRPTIKLIKNKRIVKKYKGGGAREFVMSFVDEIGSYDDIFKPESYNSRKNVLTAYYSHSERIGVKI